MSDPDFPEGRIRILSIPIWIRNPGLYYREEGHPPGDLETIILILEVVMVLKSDGNSEHVAHVKPVFSEKKNLLY